MPSLGRHWLVRRIARCLMVAVCGLAYLAASVGFPVAVRRGSNTSTASFPCQARACGCSTAEQCRHACCCSKPAIPPPVEEEEPCCKEGQSCCAAQEQQGILLPARWVIAQQWQQCKGLNLAWVTVGATLLPAPVMVLADHIPLELIPPKHIKARAIRLTPPVPPPRPAQARS